MLAQALLLRGERDFHSVEEYQHWLRAVVEREHNALLGERLAEERRHLRALPAGAMPAYTTLAARCGVGARSGWLSGPIRSATADRRAGQGPALSRTAGSLLRATSWWSACRASAASARRISTIGTSSGRWCESPGPSPVTAGARSCSRAWCFAAPTMRCAAAWASAPTPQYVRILHLAASSGEAGVEQALCDLLDGGERFDAERVVTRSDPNSRACHRSRSARRT